MSTGGSPAPARPLCSRCSAAPPPGSTDFRRALRSASDFPSFWAMRVQRRKRRSSKTTSRSQRPTIRPRPRCVCPSVCQRGIKRKHDDKDDNSRKVRKKRCDGTRNLPETTSTWLSLPALVTSSPAATTPSINSQGSTLACSVCSCVNLRILPPPLAGRTKSCQAERKKH